MLETNLSVTPDGSSTGFWFVDGTNLAPLYTRQGTERIDAGDPPISGKAYPVANAAERLPI